MAHEKSDTKLIETKHNTSRFFVESRHISWVLLMTTCLWGIYGYFKMPQRKDPVVPVRKAVAITVWRGANAEKIEQLVTKKIEEKMAQNSKVVKIESISRTSLSVVYVELDERVTETGKEFDDIKLKLDSIRDLPEGTEPVNFIKDFGDTAALMLTVASPKLDDVEIGLRARAVQQAIEQVRAQSPTPVPATAAFTLVYGFPQSMPSRLVRVPFELFNKFAKEKGFARETRIIEGPGFIGLDGVTDKDDGVIMAYVKQFIRERLQASELHPDAWLLATGGMVLMFFSMRAVH